MHENKEITRLIHHPEKPFLNFACNNVNSLKKKIHKWMTG
jgi:hypothetical protein